MAWLTERKNEKKGFGRLFLLMLTSSVLACVDKDSRPPRVVSTFPQNESNGVDPFLDEISIASNKEMMDGNWSWVYEDKSTFPQMMGQACYAEDMMRNVLPVKLEPNKQYVIWINSKDHKNFEDRSRNSAFPFKLRSRQNST